MDRMVLSMGGVPRCAPVLSFEVCPAVLVLQAPGGESPISQPGGRWWHSRAVPAHAWGCTRADLGVLMGQTCRRNTGLWRGFGGWALATTGRCWWRLCATVTPGTLFTLSINPSRKNEMIEHITVSTALQHGSSSVTRLKTHLE